MTTKEDLILAIQKSWDKNTALGNGERWNEECPEIDQCAVTAMIVQDYLGGDLLRCKCDNGDSHYWNRLPDGTELDLTFDQFACLEVIPDKNSAVIREREYVNSFPDTVERYKILKDKVEKGLSTKQALATTAPAGEGG